MTTLGIHHWRNPWVRWSVLSIGSIGLVAILVGFVWLPSGHADFTAEGLWASICRAAGVPSRWDAGAGPARRGASSTSVVLDVAMSRPGSSDAIGRGATLALQCTMCHGVQGVSEANAPNLAGQYPEVIIKQLIDYQHGDRSSAIMQALAANLSRRDIDDLAAYYAYLPKARTAATTYDEALPALVRVGAPMRNIAPCISCHGGVDQKLGAPWIEGMPRDYLVAQLIAFRDGKRHNDSEAQMRNMARAMTDKEIDEVAAFYARKAIIGDGR